ncbi:MAG: glycosyltransferase family 39 protein [Acidiphilium sp.]|nr:glycosyltransferase family 39 protein [Acidiphilium sp.]MDD4935016.1 glycosyltransferase family 39 protein [Acidiphilium sp.]
MIRSGTTKIPQGAVVTGWAGAFAIFAVALAARLFGLGAKPFWLDEVFTVNRASLPVPALIANSLRNHHLPSFFLLEHALIGLGAGPGTWALRAIPAVAGALTAVLVFAIAWKIGGRAAAWLAGLLMALAPLQVGFGQEARSYTMMMAFILLALWGLIGLALEPDAAACRLRERAAPRRAWAAYGVGTLGALWTLGDSIPWLIAANIAMVVAILPRVTAKRRFLVNWGVIQAAIVFAAAPGYIAMMQAVRDHVMRSFSWIPPLSLRAGWSDAASLYGLRDATMVTMHLLPTPIPALAAIVFVSACAGVWHLRRQRAPLIVLVIAFVGLPISLALISLIHPVLLPRYLLWSAAPFFILAGFGIEALPRRGRTLILGAAAVMLAVNLFPYYRAETKPRWNEAAVILDGRMAAGDMLLVSDGSAPFMLDFDLKTINPNHARWKSTSHVKRAAIALAHGHRVFAVYGPAGQGKEPGEPAFLAKIAALGGTAAPIRAGSEITIEQIDPGSPGVVACSDGNTDPAACP